MISATYISPTENISFVPLSLSPPFRIIFSEPTFLYCIYGAFFFFFFYTISHLLIDLF